MIIKTDYIFLKLRTVTYMGIVSYQEAKVIKKGWLFFPDITEKVTRYKLEMIYLGEDGISYSKNWTCGTKDPLVKLLGDIVGQIRLQDHQHVDELFEKALDDAGKDTK